MSEQTTEQAVDEQPPFSPLVAAVLTKMFADSAATTNALLDSYKHRADRAEAELQLVRERISALLDGPYMPTPDELLRSLRPSRDEVDALLDDAGEC